MKNKIKRMTIFLMCSVLLFILSVNHAYAQQQQQQQEVKPEYVLTYPDGSTETYENYDEAKAKLDEWKLLYEGKTNPEGLIELKGWASKGEIKIVEKKVPEGYTAETTETIVDLSEGEVEIVNTKVEEDEVNDEADEPNVTKGAKTGDDENVLIWLSIILACLTATAAMAYSRKQ